MSKWGALCDEYQTATEENQFGEEDEEEVLDEDGLPISNAGEMEGLDDAEAMLMMAGGGGLSGSYMISGPPPPSGQGAPKDALSILSINIPSSNRQSDIAGKVVVWYEIHLRTATHQWRVTKRYRDCSTFHDELKAVGLTIDSFPGKTLFNRDSDDNFIAQRRQQLDSYFRSFLRILQAMTEQGRRDAPALATKAAAGFSLFMDFCRADSRSNLSTVKNPQHRQLLVSQAKKKLNMDSDSEAGGFGAGDDATHRTARALGPSSSSKHHLNNNSSLAGASASNNSFTNGRSVSGFVGSTSSTQAGAGREGSPLIRGRDLSVRNLSHSPSKNYSNNRHSVSSSLPKDGSHASLSGEPPKTRVILQPRFRFIIMMYLPGVTMQDVYVAPNVRDTHSVVVGGNWTDPSMLLDMIAPPESDRQQSARQLSARSNMSATSTGGGGGSTFTGGGGSSCMLDKILMDTAPAGDFEMVIDVPPNFPVDEWKSDFADGILYLVWDYKPPVQKSSHRRRSASARARANRSASAASRSGGDTARSTASSTGRRISHSAKTPTRNKTPPPPVEDQPGAVVGSSPQPVEDQVTGTSKNSSSPNGVAEKHQLKGRVAGGTAPRTAPPKPKEGKENHFDPF